MHRFPSLALKSRIDAAVWLFLRVSLQRFQSLPLEIRNRCSRGVVAFCRRNHSSLRQRKTESDADLVAATAAAGETILLCGNKKNRIGRGESLQSQGKIGKNHAVISKSGHQLMNQCQMDIFEGAKEFGTFLETRGNANQNPKRYERHYQTCFISSIGSCGHSGPCQQLRPVKRRKLYNFTQQFFIIA